MPDTNERTRRVDLREVCHLRYETEDKAVCGDTADSFVRVRLDRQLEQVGYLRRANIHNVLLRYCNVCLNILS